MDRDEQQDDTIYHVVMNHEEQYSIWPAHKEIPPGWQAVGKSGPKTECLDYIEQVWTDMRPLSLRQRMAANSADEGVSGPAHQPARREPNFFLVGASRAGTTSLWQYLVQHPDIFMPTRALAEKEPSYFCEVAPRWALAYREKDRYLGLFAEATHQKAVGEASTPYLVAPEVPARLRKAYPDAKIVIVLRNPAERAFSLYRYLCLIGGEWVPTFERALALEASRIADQTFKHRNPLWYGLFEYFNSGLYSAQVARYLAEFPREQVEIVLYDELDADSLGSAQRIYRFLGVDPSFSPEIRRVNKSLFPLSVRFQYLIGHDMDRSARGTMGSVRGQLFLANARLGRFLPRAFNPQTRRRLLDAYRDDIAKTASILGRPLDGWLETHGSAS